MPDVRFHLLFALILLSAAALRLSFLAGAVFYDDYHYLQRAVDLALGAGGPPQDIFATRIGLVGPPAVLFRTFGVSPLTATAFPLLCSLGSVAGAYFFGSHLLDRRTGLVAAALLAVCPLDVIFAGELFATTPLTLFVGVSLGCFLLAEEQSSAAYYLASGLSLGLGAVVHETALLALMFYPAYVALVARPARRQRIFVAGLLLGLAIDPVIHGLLGDPWARLSILKDAKVVQAESPDSFNRGLTLSWLTEPFTRMLVEQELGLFPWLIVPVAAIRSMRADARSVRALALFVAVVSLWLLFGSVSPFRYAPLSRQPRYLAPVVLPAVLLLGHEIVRWRSRRMRAAILAVLLVSSILCVIMDGGRARLLPYREACRVLTETRTSRVLVEPGQSLPLLLVAGSTPRYSIATFDPTSDLPHGAVILAVTEAARQRLDAAPGVEVLARIPQPDTIYYRLLRTSMVMGILRMTRSEARIHDLEGKRVGWVFDLYRTP